MLIFFWYRVSSVVLIFVCCLAVSIEEIREVRVGTGTDSFARAGFSTVRPAKGHTFAVVRERRS